MSAAPTNAEKTELEAAIGSIDRLLDELAELSEQSISPERFYQELLDRAVVAVEAEAAAIWSPGPGGQLVLASHSQANHVYPASQHARFRRDRESFAKLMEKGGRDATVLGLDRGQPMACSLVSMQGRSTAILVLYCSSKLNDAAVRIHAQFVSALAELAEDFEKGHRVQHHDAEVQRWKSLNACAVAAYQSLDPRKTAFELVNEGRVYLQCDRVSMFRMNGRSCKILASSGLASLDSRAEVVRKMRSLARKVARTREPFFYKEGMVDVPRKLDKSLRTYLAESGARSLAVIPLLSKRQNQNESQSRVLGVVVVEVISDSDTSDLLERCQLFSIHATNAMARAVQYNSIPLRPLWQAIGWLMAQVGIRRIPRTVIVLGIIAGVVLPLIFVQADFEIEARGELRPVSERNVFAPIDGYVDSLEVEHGKMVDEDEVVAILRSTELDRELKTINGQLLVIAKKIGGLSLGVAQSNPNSQEAQLLQAQSSAEIEALKQQEINLKEQREDILERMKELEVKSPIDGQVLTWQVERDLPTRPVRQGESLLKVADVKGEWQLELKVPDRKIGYVTNAAKEEEEPLEIKFVLESDPDRVSSAWLENVASTASATPGEPAYVLVTAGFDKGKVGQLRPATTVIARVQCGRRSLGYVWLHDMIDAVERRFFW